VIDRARLVRTRCVSSSTRSLPSTAPCCRPGSRPARGFPSTSTSGSACASISSSGSAISRCATRWVVHRANRIFRAHFDTGRAVTVKARSNLGM